MKSAYKKDLQRKRRTRAVKEAFPEPQKKLSYNQSKQIIQINNNTIVLAPAEASTLQIRSRYEQGTNTY